MRWRLGRRLGASGRLRRRLGASFRRSELLFGVLHRLVLNGHVGQGGRGFPEAHEPLPGQDRPGTGIRASHSERGRRPGATRKQEDQRGRAGSRSERSEEAASAHHGDPGAGLSCPGGQFASRNIDLLAGYDHSQLFNSGRGHQALATRGADP
jgi:hypothetical protein